MDAMTEFTAIEKYQSILREIKYRRQVYPRLVERKKMRQETADREIEIMIAIGQDYEKQTQSERLL
jgi:hypothetical protein